MDEAQFKAEFDALMVRANLRPNVNYRFLSPMLGQIFGRLLAAGEVALELQFIPRVAAVPSAQAPVAEVPAPANRATRRKKARSG